MITKHLDFTESNHGRGSVIHVVTVDGAPVFTHIQKCVASDVFHLLCEWHRNVKLFDLELSLLDNSDWI